MISENWLIALVSVLLTTILTAAVNDRKAKRRRANARREFAAALCGRLRDHLTRLNAITAELARNSLPAVPSAGEIDILCGGQFHLLDSSEREAVNRVRRHVDRARGVFDARIVAFTLRGGALPPEILVAGEAALSSARAACIEAIRLLEKAAAGPTQSNWPPPPPHPDRRRLGPGDDAGDRGAGGGEVGVMRHPY